MTIFIGFSPFYFVFLGGISRLEQKISHQTVVI